MDVTEATARFVALVQGPESEETLADGALLIAAHAHPHVDLDLQRRTLDALAAACPEPTVDALVRHLFVSEGFRGNHEDYADPRNSYLDDVLERRLGIPITLAVVLVEVGRRLGLTIGGVNMPGHFLVRAEEGGSPVILDPFHGGRRLDWQQCEAQFATVAGPGVAFDAALLEPVGARVVLARMLANLKQVFTTDDDARNLAWVLRLRSSIPGVGARDRLELASAVAAIGRFDEAAAIYDGLASELQGEQADRLTHKATRLRARLN